MALHYVDKPETYISDLASTGVYIFTNEIFDHIDKILAARADELEKLPKKAFHDDFDRTQDSLMLESDVLPNLASNKKLGLYITQDFWRQIKTAASAVPANGLYLNSAKQEIPGYCAEGKEGGPEIVGAVYIHPSAVVDPSAKIGPNVSIHAKSHIGAGVRIKDAIILDNVIIKDNAAIINAIVGWGGKIGRWSRVEGNPDNGDEKTDQVTSSGVKIDSICILGQDITVSDEAFVRNSIVLPHKHISSDIHNEIIM
ncbi:Mannose-1-phosphate guanyltransferase alpha-B [Zancudomyces culisetae]|nr:Mannose-1-phosphate guanyltransferase alpha-B [Zancudomyces culisetae]|eukprot:OMH81588.1 Mannose-1-phosphate guanyltransferase alpha-B [Zancudomyces culisetae]